MITLYCFIIIALLYELFQTIGMGYVCINIYILLSMIRMVYMHNQSMSHDYLENLEVVELT